MSLLTVSALIGMILLFAAIVQLLHAAYLSRLPRLAQSLTRMRSVKLKTRTQDTTSILSALATQLGRQATSFDYVSTDGSTVIYSLPPSWQYSIFVAVTCEQIDALHSATTIYPGSKFGARLIESAQSKAIAHVISALAAEGIAWEFIEGESREG